MPDATSVMAAADKPARQDEPQRPLRSVVGSLAEMIAKGAIDRGEVADLRRLRSGELAPAAFWRLFVSIIEPAGWALASSSRAGEREAQWASVLNLLAIAEGLHAPSPRLGQALAEAGFSEMRFARLLRAQGPRLEDEIRLMARFLAAKGAPADLSDAAWLVLSAESDRGEDVRRRMARDYYTHSAD